MARLNYHHLYYFWTVAKQGNLTRAAETLHISQSALSTQIRQLEDSLGQTLFLREGRRLSLSEAGRIAMAYAEDIFRRGEELNALMREGPQQERQSLRIGAMATLSRNFQEAFIGPLMKRQDIQLVLQSGRLDDLLAGLNTHSLDLVLSNVAVRASTEYPWRCRRIARQQVSVMGRPLGSKPFRFPEDLRQLPLVLPGETSDIRATFDALCDQWDIRPNIVAEVDDMAMLRLLARDSGAVAVLPKVVVRDEVSNGTLVEYCALPKVYENFYAITIKRHFQKPLMKELLARPEQEMLVFGPADLIGPE